jgi:large subunit ribosomal protein L30e
MLGCAFIYFAFFPFRGRHLRGLDHEFHPNPLILIHPILPFIFTVTRNPLSLNTMPTDTSANNLNAALKLVMKSGKYKLGYRETLRTLRSGRSKLVLVSNNCPTVRQSEIEYYAMLSKTPVHRFDGGNTELGTACGRYFQVSMLTILESGDSDILQVAGN